MPATFAFSPVDMLYDLDHYVRSGTPMPKELVEHCVEFIRKHGFEFQRNHLFPKVFEVLDRPLTHAEETQIAETLEKQWNALKANASFDPTNLHSFPIHVLHIAEVLPNGWLKNKLERFGNDGYYYCSSILPN